MARVIKPQFECIGGSLVTLGDRVYGIADDQKKLLCLDPVTEEQATISLGAAAPHKTAFRSRLVVCEGNLFVCLQFHDRSWRIIKYDPAAKTYQTVKTPGKSSAQGILSGAVGWNGKVYLLCQGGVWELNAATEAMHFVKATLGWCHCAFGSDGKLHIFSRQDGVGCKLWELDPVTRNWQRCCFEPRRGQWKGAANLQGRIYASLWDGKDTSIFQLQHSGGSGVTSLKEVAITGLCGHRPVAVGEDLVTYSGDKLMVYNPTTGDLKNRPLHLGQDSSSIYWFDLCVACGKLVGLSSHGSSLLIVDLATTLGPAVPTADDQTQQAVAKNGQHAGFMLRELLDHLHTVKVTVEAATAYDRVKARAATESVIAAIDMGKAATNAIVVAESCANTARQEAKAAAAAAAAAAEKLKQAESSAETSRHAAAAARAVAAELAEKLKQVKCEVQKEAAWQLLSRLPRAGDEARELLSALPAIDPRNAMICEILKESCVQHRRDLKAQDFCPAPDLVPTGISVVCNPGLAEQYQFARKQLQERQSTGTCRQLPEVEHLLLPCTDGCGRNQLNEVLLFHGALPDTVQKICQEGFDPRRGGEGAGAMFGVGTYFAANASKADIYTERHSSKLPRGAPRELIVARVLLGEAYRATDRLKNAHRPPDSASGRPYDSVWADTRANGGAVDHLEFIIYDKVQAVPVLVITYHHAATCQCAECSKRPAQ